MTTTLYHLHGDESGDTHVEVVELAAEETYAGVVRGLRQIPATSAGWGEFVERKPDVGVHQAPRRQFLVVLSGVLEIVTTLGDEAHLQPGDILLADDVGSKGHISRDVGEEPLGLLAIGITDDWTLPA